MSESMPVLKLLTVKQQLFPLFKKKNLDAKQSEDVQFELLHHKIKFHLDQTKSVAENKARRFCFALTQQARSRSVKAV